MTSCLSHLYCYNVLFFSLVSLRRPVFLSRIATTFCCFFLSGNHYENLHEASLGVAEKVKPANTAASAETAPPTTERREELIKEMKTTRTQVVPPKKSAAQLKKEAEEDARVKQVSDS